MSIGQTIIMVSGDIPEGLYYYGDVLPLKLKDRVITFLLNEWRLGNFKEVGETKNSGILSRKVLQFGYEYIYTTHSVKKIDRNLPQIILDIIKYLPKYSDTKFNQCIINRYENGQGITPHIDAECFGSVICCFTFGEGSLMNFKRVIDEKEYNLRVEDNSVYIMSGESRYEWKHSMPNLESNNLNRYSITLRIV